MHAPGWRSLPGTRAPGGSTIRGWVDDGPVVYPAEGPDGPIDVPAHRYVKELT
jgi:hypothetical protein